MEKLTRSKAFCLLICCEAEYTVARDKYMQTGAKYAEYLEAKSQVEDAGSAYIEICRDDYRNKPVEE